MKFAPVDRNASAAIKASVVLSLKRFAHVRVAVAGRDLFRPIRVQGRKIMMRVVNHKALEDKLNQVKLLNPAKKP